MDAYPGIVFREGPAGRRPGVVGGPDVWEVVETFLAEDREIRAVAENLGLRPGLVQAAIAYYADNQEAIDEWIEVNGAMMEEAAAAFDRQRALEDGRTTPAS